MEDLEKEITKLERYLIKEGRKEFVEEIRLNPAGREAKLISLFKHLQEIEETMKNDEELQKTRKTASALAYPYNRQKLMNKKLRRFIFLLNKEQGYE